MAVPLSPEELDRKIAAIHKHESQKDKALFEHRTQLKLKHTYDQKYEAMEAVRAPGE